MPTSAVESPITKSAGTSGAGRGDEEGEDVEFAAAAAEHRRGPERNRSRRASKGATAISGARARWRAVVSWRAQLSGVQLWAAWLAGPDVVS